jgi:hypothetical protein
MSARTKGWVQTTTFSSTSAPKLTNAQHRRQVLQRLNGSQRWCMSRHCRALTAARTGSRLGVASRNLGAVQLEPRRPKPKRAAPSQWRNFEAERCGARHSQSDSLRNPTLDLSGRTRYPGACPLVDRVSPVQANGIVAFDAQGFEFEPTLTDEWLKAETFPAGTCFQSGARGADAT